MPAPSRGELKASEDVDHHCIGRTVRAHITHDELGAQVL
jgi:hypothetical protein